MKLEVSNGEVVDKYTILKIKSERIRDEAKLNLVRSELASLSTHIEHILRTDTTIQTHIDELYEVNTLLWDIENSIREKEHQLQFDDEFIRLARSVYHTNDRRAKIKLVINQKTNSGFVEVKEYSEYES